jgi:DNA sulfur modification protein DndB
MGSGTLPSQRSPHAREGFEFSFPAIRGVQGGREYYVAMCPLRSLSQLLKFNEEEIAPEIRAQRLINRARIPELAKYITDHPTEYVFSSLTASIDGIVRFEPTAERASTGRLFVPFNAKMVVNDGQHRRAGIEEALKERPELGDETLSVVLFVDRGLKRSQQMFADLNRYAVRPTRSIGILYDHRDRLSHLARELAGEVATFRGLVEMERTAISNRSRKLFTLSGIYHATKRFLRKSAGAEVSDQERKLAAEFWTEVGKHMPDWQAATTHSVSTAELRRDTIHAHGVALQAIAVAGAELVSRDSTRWRVRLKGLEKIDWSRSNSGLWEGRATVGGRVSKTEANVIMTANVLKDALGLPLSKIESEGEVRRDTANR